MALVALLMGLLMAAVSLFGVVLPDALVTMVRSVVTPLGLYLAAAFRVVFGVILILAAPSSRAPNFLRVLGFILVFAGIITPLFGVDRAGAIVDWWAAQDPTLLRVWAGFGVAFGAFVVYAVIPRRRVV